MDSSLNSIMLQYFEKILYLVETCDVPYKIMHTTLLSRADCKQSRCIYIFRHLGCHCRLQNVLVYFPSPWGLAKVDITSRKEHWFSAGARVVQNQKEESCNSRIRVP